VYSASSATVGTGQVMPGQSAYGMPAISSPDEAAAGATSTST
jgi:hypothetical protein